MSQVATAPRPFRSSADTPLLTRIPMESARPEMLDQLQDHLADMDRLCRQAKRARAECRPYRDPCVPLFDELIDTLERHRELIAGQLGEGAASEGRS